MRKLPRLFDIFSLLMFTNPLCTQYLHISHPQYASLCHRHGACQRVRSRKLSPWNRRTLACFR